MITNKVTLTICCLDNVIVQHADTFYKQKEGTITGDNLSVSLANIAFIIVLTPIAAILNHVHFSKRFIDDIVWLPHGEDITLEIEGASKDVFGQNGLQLTFRKINTHQNEGNVEFLDVNHVIDHNALHIFITKDFIKPTAINWTFLWDKSHHPPHAFQSITYCEAMRMRRLNETQEGYLCSLERLHTKCLLSGFNNKMVVRIFSIAKTWTGCFQAPPTPNHEESTNSKNTGAVVCRDMSRSRGTIFQRLGLEGLQPRSHLGLGTSKFRKMGKFQPYFQSERKNPQ